MRYRLALDIGANSIGWCCLRLDEAGRPAGILGMGVRVFPDGRNPKDGSSNAAARRRPRAMRRNRDRYLQRRRALLNALTRFGLMPADHAARRAVAESDPWRLRAEALARRLAPEELGRVLFHLNQRRGFASKRIGTGSNNPDDPEEKRFGRVPNPTVHVGLNELRRVVNALIDRFGHPHEVVVEVLRELGRSQKQRQEIEREQAENQRANERRAATLKELGFPVNGWNLMRLRLYDEQGPAARDRVCPYTGTIITPRTALSEEVEEDHILPFSLTLDDSPANRVLCTREANRLKRRQSPFDAFGHTAQWPEILERAQLLPPHKRWRFQPDALERLKRDGDLLARHMTESAWLARLARMYLEAIAPQRVVAVPGRITAMLRDVLGLNSDTVLGKGGTRKDRTDHRHHAIDAVVVGLIDRAFLHRVQTAARRSEEEGRRRFADLGEPWPGFVATVAAAARAIVVSHKPDHGWQDALHNDTAYGPIIGAKDGEPNVTVRRPIETLAEMRPEDAERVRDPVLRERLRAALTIADRAARKAALAAIEHPTGVPVRRVRMMERLDRTVAIADRRTGRRYKVMKRDGNHRAEVWRMPDGKLRLRVVSTFDAAQEAEARRLGRKVPDLRPHPAAKLLMRLHKNDMVALGQGQARRILVVVNLDPGGLVFADHFATGNIRERHRNPNDRFRYVMLSATGMQRKGVRAVSVDPAGVVRDPGPIL